MSGHRQAAVALHAVGKADQEAVLAELPAADQDILRTYLAELSELGFDAEVAQAAAVGMPAVSSPAVNGKPLAAREQLRLADALSMYEVLNHEPASLIAQLLSLETWPWAADFLDQFAPARRALIVDAFDSGSTLATARVQFLLDTISSAALRAQQARQVVSKPVVSKPSPFAALKKMVATWTR